MVNSKQKGKRGELEFCTYLRERGIAARRGQQFSGSPDSPDVVSDLPVHWEIKYTEKLRIYPAIEQAKADCGGVMPVVAHRASRKRWLAILDMDDFLRLFNARL